MSELKSHKTVQAALEYVSKYPPSTDAPIQMPVWESVARKLFQIANSPNPQVRGSMGRSNRAQKILLNRLIGRRMPGTDPVGVEQGGLEFVDMTVTGEIQ